MTLHYSVTGLGLFFLLIARRRRVLAVTHRESALMEFFPSKLMNVCVFLLMPQKPQLQTAKLNKCTSWKNCFYSWLLLLVVIRMRRRMKATFKAVKVSQVLLRWLFYQPVAFHTIMTESYVFVVTLNVLYMLYYMRSLLPSTDREVYVFLHQ